MGKNPGKELGKLFVKLRDEKLISETLNGNGLSFARLVELYENRVRIIGARFFREKSDIDDFCQNVFLKTYTNLHSFKGKSLFSTWLTRIAFTTAMNEKTRTKQADSLDDSVELVSKGKTPEEQQMAKETADAIREAVKELPAEYSECVNLFFFNGLSHAEISSVTGIPVNTVKSHVFRAKKILAEKLKDYK
ncbi:MAG: sigma-70 family RNA polymerase sigma factor [Treponema sp.]|nr:sigma-70 family RNA polymerase sigma factor [Spirochaetia bacterium]MDD7460836.1 sigma-70 family RNA polymerase sigma factor [Spirochaetales bacterium]MDY5810970.1 sigma-70 family RNA polymerase sigma factor [Treponema sp.]MEE1181769.1 sigma-70 family RNA polymerase sigma factor [Treponema sp.]